MKHLGANNILSEQQYGFRHSRSCDTLLVSLLHDLSHCYDAGMQTDLIFTDFAEAFDTEPHQRLLYKLEWYGNRRNVKNWISLFCIIVTVFLYNRFSWLVGIFIVTIGILL